MRLDCLVLATVLLVALGAINVLAYQGRSLLVHRLVSNRPLLKVNDRLVCRENLHLIPVGVGIGVAIEDGARNLLS